MDTIQALDDLVSALERRTVGLTARQFENIISPGIARAFLNAWQVLGRNEHDIPGEWLDLLDID